MVHKSKMTIQGPMLFISKRHWPGLSGIRENEVKAAELPGPGSGIVAPLLPFVSQQLFLALKNVLAFWRITLGYHPSFHHTVSIYNPSSHLSVFTEGFSISLTAFQMTACDSVTCHQCWSSVSTWLLHPTPWNFGSSLTLSSTMTLFFTTPRNLCP